MLTSYNTLICLSNIDYMVDVSLNKMVFPPTGTIECNLYNI